MVAFVLSGPVWSFVPMHQRSDVFTWTDAGHIALGGLTVLLLSTIIVTGAGALGRRFRVFSHVLAPIVVIKEGAEGCRVLWRDIDMEIAARPFKAADTTGAGDGFDAGFLFSLISTISDGRAPGELRQLDLRHAGYDGGKAAAAFIRGPRSELDL